MQPNKSGGSTITWTGTAAGRIGTGADKTVAVVSIDSSALKYKKTFPKGAPYEGKLNGLGNVLQESGKYTYTCDTTTLSIKGVPFNSTFKREKKEP